MESYDNKKTNGNIISPEYNKKEMEKSYITAIILSRIKNILMITLYLYLIITAIFMFVFFNKIEKKLMTYILVFVFVTIIIFVIFLIINTRLKKIVKYDLKFKIYERVFQKIIYNPKDGFNEDVTATNFFSKPFKTAMSLEYINGHCKNKMFELTNLSYFFKEFKLLYTESGRLFWFTRLQKKKPFYAGNFVIIHTEEYISSPFYILSKYRNFVDTEKILKYNFTKHLMSSKSFNDMFDFYCLDNITYFDPFNNGLIGLVNAVELTKEYIMQTTNLQGEFEQELLVYGQENKIYVIFDKHIIYTGIDNIMKKMRKKEYQIDDIRQLKKDVLTEAVILEQIINAFD